MLVQNIHYIKMGYDVTMTSQMTFFVTWHLWVIIFSSPLDVLLFGLWNFQIIKEMWMFHFVIFEHSLPFECCDVLFGNFTTLQTVFQPLQKDIVVSEFLFYYFWKNRQKWARKLNKKSLLLVRFELGYPCSSNIINKNEFPSGFKKIF